MLVIENDPATRTALTRLLQSWSLHVAAFADVAAWEADMSEPKPPDLVIADYHLDDGAIGLEAVARIRALTHRTLPAIVVTADHSDAVEALVLEARCELVHKPVRPAQLRSLLSYMIQSAPPSHRGLSRLIRACAASTRSSAARRAASAGRQASARCREARRSPREAHRASAALRDGWIEPSR